MTDHRQSLCRKRLLKVYRKEIIISAVLALFGLMVFIIMGWKGFLWIAGERSRNDLYPFSSGMPELIIAACGLFLVEVLILNFTVLFIARIRWIYKKAEKASREKKMFRHNIIKKYKQKNEEGL